MATRYNRRYYGLFDNGCGQDNNNDNFSSYSSFTGDPYSGEHCLAVDYNIYGTTTIGTQKVPVDPANKQYRIGAMAKSIKPNYLGNYGGGYMGFACYDKNNNFIDQRNTGQFGQTTLTRAANPGDSSIYVADASGWYTGSDWVSQRIFCNYVFFPATHPDYSTPYEYSRLGFGVGTTLYYDVLGPTDIGGGEWRIDILDVNRNAITLPDYGYALPAGTPIANTRAGGTYQYALGNPVVPTEWTSYKSSTMTGFGYGSGATFRYGTDSISWMNIRNYPIRSENSGDGAWYLLDNIILVETEIGATISDNIFTNRRIS